MEKIIANVFTGKYFDVHQDWENPIPGFFILASIDTSKKSVTDFSDEEALELMDILRKVRTAMRDVLDISAIQIYQSEITEHGFHVWIFPRYEWMQQFGEKIQSVRPIMEYAKGNMMTPQCLQDVKEAAAKVKQSIQSL